MAEAKSEVSGTVSGLVRALGTVLGVHIQYAQREAKSDIGRVIGGVVILLVAAMLIVFALLFGHAALALYVASKTKLTLMGAVGVVAAGDLALAILLTLVGRSRLNKPVLKETRTLMKRTVESFADV